MKRRLPLPRERCRTKVPIKDFPPGTECEIQIRMYGRVLLRMPGGSIESLDVERIVMIEENKDGQ